MVVVKLSPLTKEALDGQTRCGLDRASRTRRQAHVYGTQRAVSQGHGHEASTVRMMQLGARGYSGSPALTT